MAGVGTGFFSKAASIQDENRKQENDMLMEDYREFNKSLTVYRAAKAEQTKQDNAARAFGMIISGDPRDQDAVNIGRQLIIAGHDPKDPIAQALGQSQWKNIQTQKAQQAVATSVQTNGGGTAGVGTPPANVANPNAPVPSATNAPQAAPGLGGPTQTPQDTPQGVMQQPQGIMGGLKNAVLGKSSPEQFQAKSLQNISSRTGMTPEQVQAIRTGADTGQSVFNPTTKGAPVNPGNALIMKTAMDFAAKGEIKDLPGFINALNNQDWASVGKFIPNVDERNAFHERVAKIQAQSHIDAANIGAGATIESAKIHAQSAKDTADVKYQNDPKYALGTAHEKLRDINNTLQSNPETYAGILNEYNKTYPGMDLNNPAHRDYIAHQILRQQDGAAFDRLQGGTNNKPVTGMNKMIDPAQANFNPTPIWAKSATPGKPGEPTKSGTEPPAKGVDPQIKARADAIKAKTDPEEITGYTQSFIKTYGEKVAKEYGLSVPKVQNPNGLTPPSPDKEKELNTIPTLQDKTTSEPKKDVFKSTKENQNLFKTVPGHLTSEKSAFLNAVDNVKADLEAGRDFEEATKEALDTAKKANKDTKITREDIKKSIKING